MSTTPCRICDMQPRSKRLCDACHRDQRTVRLWIRRWPKYAPFLAAAESAGREGLTT